MAVPEGFEAFATARWSKLVQSARLLGCTAEEAEDLVQATLERTLPNWKRVESAASPDSYVHRILFNTLTSWRRRRWSGESARPDPVARGSSKTNDGFEIEAILDIRAALGDLPIGQRAVVVMRYYVGMSESEIAAALDVAPGTVKSRHARALRTLSEKLENKAIRIDQ